eukprot:TRINITY_DN17100_c0_g1_i1.p1 TRINITY_DN17100_c0_g1~~TRINITY_DN17100_c0_g1_i1.p1  ORF type:complete len:474 (+),score=129.50 TRINITY_DN17100_c0_g1_i1:227-1648(+)
MGCGASTGKMQRAVEEHQAKLQECRRQMGERDDCHLHESQLLVQQVSRWSQEASDGERLQQEIAASRAEHRDQLAFHRAEMEEMHRQNLDFQLASQEQMAKTELEDETMVNVLTRTAIDEVVQKCAMEMDTVQEKNFSMTMMAETHLREAREELAEAQEAFREAVARRDADRAAIVLLDEEVAAEQRIRERRDEEKAVEARTRLSEVEALRDAERGLEGQVRSLQHELSRVTYVIGQRDQELRAKDSELIEVRQTVVCIQDDMEGVNTKLKEQCDRVHRVETTLKQSRDLGDRVKSMREMLRESNDMLVQLCGVLEQERSKKEECTQGLRQQRVRTELLLQLLQHFKNRAQDLAPQALLGRSALLSNGSSGGLESTSVGDSPAWCGYVALDGSAGMGGVGTSGGRGCTIGIGQTHGGHGALGANGPGPATGDVGGGVGAGSAFDFGPGTLRQVPPLRGAGLQSPGLSTSMNNF